MTNPLNYNIPPTSGHSPLEGVFARTVQSTQLERPADASKSLFGFNSRDRRSRPFNLLRSQVIKIAEAKKLKIIGITSATPGVGKSFIASNLAASLSRIPDKRVFLLDLDLRRGSIGKIYDTPFGPGLNSYLNGQIKDPSLTAFDIEGTGLTVFPCFPTDEPSDEILSGDHFKKLLQDLRSLPENLICICDLPPAFANDDASIVLREIDGYFFVVEEGMTTAKQVRDSIDILQPATLLGTILNRYRGGIGGDDYGFGYGVDNYYNEYYG